MYGEGGERTVGLRHLGVEHDKYFFIFDQNGIIIPGEMFGSVEESTANDVPSHEEIVKIIVSETDYQNQMERMATPKYLVESIMEDLIETFSGETSYDDDEINTIDNDQKFKELAFL